MCRFVRVWLRGGGVGGGMGACVCGVHAFFVIRGGEGGGEILEEAGTFSGQALLLSYPYPGGGGSSQGGRHPLTALSTVPTQYQTTRNASSREGLTTAC